MISLSKKKEEKTKMYKLKMQLKVFTRSKIILRCCTVYIYLPGGKGVKNLSRRIGKGWSNRLTKSE